MPWHFAVAVLLPGPQEHEEDFEVGRTWHRVLTCILGFDLQPTNQPRKATGYLSCSSPSRPCFKVCVARTLACQNVIMFLSRKREKKELYLGCRSGDHGLARHPFPIEPCKHMHVCLLVSITKHSLRVMDNGIFVS